MLGRLRDRTDPYRLYIGIETAMYFEVALAYTTSVVYWVQVGHLNALGLILLGTMVEASYFVLQLPTGVLADVVSRRLCVIIGMFLTSAGFLMQGLSAAFVVLLLAQVPIGFGAALMYGAQQAWLADESGNSELTSVFMRTTQLGLVGTLAGSLLSGAAATVGLAVPFIASGILIGLTGVALVFIMPERNFRPPERTADLGGILGRSWQTFAAQTGRAKRAMVAIPALVLLLLMTFFVGLWGESFDRLWGAFLLKDTKFPHLFHLDTVAWFSVIAFAVALGGLLSTEVAKRITDNLGPDSVVRTLTGFIALSAVAVVVMGLSRTFVLAVIAYLVVAITRPVIEPLTTGWVVARVEPQIRATALSAVDMFASGGQILGGPIVGVVGVLASLRAALLTGAAALAPAVGFLLMATRRLTAHKEWAEAEAPDEDDLAVRPPDGIPHGELG
jgi:DHA3 family tetracycline resistance protein-like MFS transporter